MKCRSKITADVLSKTVVFIQGNVKSQSQFHYIALNTLSTFHKHLK